MILIQIELSLPLRNPFLTAGHQYEQNECQDYGHTQSQHYDQMLIQVHLIGANLDNIKLY